MQKILPFQSNRPHQKQLLRPTQSRYSPSVKERYRENARSPNRELSNSAGTPTSKISDFDLQSSSPPSSLTAWKRQLRTCIESNPRHQAKHEAEHQTERLRNSVNRSLILNRRQSCTSDSNSTKCYKILNYQNSTLASICVQGKDPPTKERTEPLSRLRLSNYSIPLFQNSIENLQNPEKNSEPDSVIASTLMSLPNDETMTQSDFSSSTTTESDRELSEDDDAALIDMFPQQEAFFEDHHQDNNHDVITPQESQNANESLLPNLELINLTFPQDEEEPSDNESDISEQEMSSEDEENGLTDLQANKKQSQVFMEKYKELYKNENISDSKNLSSSKNQTSENESELAEKPKTLNEREIYEFASVFPKKFQKYNLRELSMLPSDVNWKNVVRITDLFPDYRATSRNNRFAKRRRPQSGKKIEAQNKMETFVDRLLSMEKIQRATLRAESMNRFHAAHTRAAAAAKIKAQNAKAASNQAGNDEEKRNESPPEPFGSNPRTSSRRRSSVPLASARLAWANEITQGGQNILKEAHRSGDFSAVIDDWSSKNRPTKNCNERGRRFSENSVKKFRSRWMHPRFYQYQWSERTKDDKIRSTPFWTSRLRSCPTCREKWRKILSNEVQERRRRPR